MNLGTEMYHNVSNVSLFLEAESMALQNFQAVSDRFERSLNASVLGYSQSKVE